MACSVTLVELEWNVRQCDELLRYLVTFQLHGLYNRYIHLINKDRNVSVFLTFSKMSKTDQSRNSMEIADDLWTYDKSNRKAMNRNWSNQKANPALKTKVGNK